MPGRVTLVVRAQSLDAGMSHYLVREVEATPNVEVRTSAAVVSGGGEGRLQELVLRQSATGEEDTVAADALRVDWSPPATDWLPGEIARDERGFLLTGDNLPDADDWPLEPGPFSLESSMPGVLAAGDVRHGSVKRVASAVREGSIAIQIVQSLFANERLHPRRPTEALAPAGRASAR